MKDMRRQVKNALYRNLGRAPRSLKTRTDLLNHLIAVHGYTAYLEIGVRDALTNFDRVRAALKHSVDPSPVGTVTFEMASDEFFARHVSHSYDLVFVDGLHLAEQVERDVVNALKYLSADGAVVLHDCNPLTEDAQRDTYDSASLWNGSTWKAWAKFRASRSDLEMQVVDIDHGCGVIRRGAQECFRLNDVDYARLDYSTLAEHRVDLLNLVDAGSYFAASAARS
jgi:hypothetical protein